MKKLTLTLFALIALTLTGCESNKIQEQIDADMAVHITEFNYKGHKYLLYKQSYYKGGVGGITHDPDCPCREKGGENKE